MSKQQQYSAVPTYEQSEKQPLIVNMPAPGPHEVTFRATEEQSDSTPGLILFCLGFCFPLIWCIVPCAYNPKSENGKFWRKLSLIMACITVASCVVYAILLITAAASAPSAPSTRYPSMGM